jgi:hypothetical protein
VWKPCFKVAVCYYAEDGVEDVKNSPREPREEVSTVRPVGDRQTSKDLRIVCHQELTETENTHWTKD